MRIIGYSNPSGVSGFASSAALVRDVIFNTPIDNTNYIVLPVLQSIVPSGSVSITDKTTSGFRIRIDAPTGTFANGDSCYVAWIMFGY